MVESAVRIGAFNVENLFDRTKLLSVNDHTVGDDKLWQVQRLRAKLQRSTYDKPRILSLCRSLKGYIKIEETRGNLFPKQRPPVVGVKANGVSDWDAVINLKRVEVTDLGWKNTAKVIRHVNAHVMCVVEVESRPVLATFNQERLYGKKYPYDVFFDGNDDPEMDVVLLRRFDIRRLWTHIFDGFGRSRILSRGCLEVQVRFPNGDDLWALVNHLKSKGYRTQAKNDARRRIQAERVVQILNAEYDLISDLIVVAGDLNDTPARAPLQLLLSLLHLYDVLELEHPNDPRAQRTYYYRTNEQFDYILVSEPPKQPFDDASAERRWIYDVNKHANGATEAWSAVQDYGYTAAVSDHGAVWSDFRP